MQDAKVEVQREVRELAKAFEVAMRNYLAQRAQTSDAVGQGVVREKTRHQQ
jgi:hypothetical protein